MGNANDSTPEQKHAAAMAEYERVLAEQGPIAAARHRLERPGLYTAPTNAAEPTVAADAPSDAEIAAVKAKYEELKRENQYVASSYRLANMHTWRSR